MLEVIDVGLLRLQRKEDSTALFYRKNPSIFRNTEILKL